MPYIDFDRTDGPFSGEEFDYLIVGAGAAGIMLSVELTRKGRKVLLVESGHFSIDPERQAYNQVVQKGKELRNAVWGRCRAVGGTTLSWGGQSLPFNGLDFAHRDWVSHSGWPITLSDLQPHYLSANRFMGIDALDYRGQMFQLSGVRNPGLSDAVDFHFSKWSRQPNFRLMYRRELERDIPVLFNAMLTRVDTDGNGRVTGVEVGNYSHHRKSIRVKELVIAAGGIETNRILLANREPNGQCIGDHSGWLGKCFMDHPCITTGSVVARDPWAFQRLLNTNLISGRKYSKRISFSESYQRQQRLTHASASIMFGYEEGTFDPYHEIMSLKNRKLPRIGRLVRHADDYLLAAWSLLRHRFVYKPGAAAVVCMMLEQEPQTGSCIRLSGEPDAFGIPRAELHWDITEKTWLAACSMSRLIGEEFRRLQLADYTPYPHIREEEPDWKDHLHDVNHHMGGTRMSAIPQEGVVGPDLRVWGYRNLHVLSSSVFPTGSHSNPTLTILALGQKWLRENIG